MDYFLHNILPLIVSAVLGWAGFVFKQNYSIKKKLKAKDAELQNERQKRLSEENTRQNKRMDLMCTGIVSLQRMSLVEAHDKYMQAGTMPVSAKDSMDQMFQSYHSLGGNDVGTKLYNDMMTLPECKYDRA